jgi:hypothetical protein
MVTTIFALLETIFRLASNHNETFVSDEVELSVEEMEEA